MARRYQLEQAVIYQLGYLCKSFFVPELGQAVKKKIYLYLNYSLFQTFCKLSRVGQIW